MKFKYLRSQIYFCVLNLFQFFSIFETTNSNLGYQNRAIESTTPTGYTTSEYERSGGLGYTSRTDYGTENIESTSFLDHSSKSGLSKASRNDSLLKKLKKRFSSIDQSDSIDRRCSVRKTNEEWNRTYRIRN